MVALSRQHIEPEINDSTRMILYEIQNREKAINYTKKLRCENECVMMVRKRSNHEIEEYLSYAKRHAVTEMVLITENEPEIVKIDN